VRLGALTLKSQLDRISFSMSERKTRTAWAVLGAHAVWPAFGS
jgi:hypothetical protein